MLAIPKNPLVTAVKQVSSYCFRPLVASSVTNHEDFVIERKPEPLKNFPNTIRSNNRAAKSIGGTVQRRYAHTDVYNKMPSYEGYRKTSASTTMAPSNESDIARKTFTYMTVGVTAVTGVYAAKNVVTTALGYLAKTKDTLAMAQTEVDLTSIPEGKSVVVTWRCKPVFIRHRTAEEAELEKSVELGTLRDPQHDDDRTRHPNWLVVIGICTHLGCIPVANAGQFGGYYCPCHGSHYDVSGRIRKGPAPLNLEVPHYDFPEENLLVIG